MLEELYKLVDNQMFAWLVVVYEESGAAGERT
jgi:hypothetical protein